MKKGAKLLVLIMAIAMLATSLYVTAAADNSITAAPASSTIYINGTAIAFDAYTINGNNYFKLRDLAKALNGTAKQFEVGFDSASNSIAITTGKAYTPVGGELVKSGNTGAVAATQSSAKIMFNGRQINLTAYTILGYNFFKLRDIGSYVNFNVAFDPAANAVKVDTAKNYLFDMTGNWAYEYAPGLIYNFTLAKDGTVSETMAISGTYKFSGNVVTATIGGSGHVETTTYNLATYNGTSVLTVSSSLAFPRYYKVSGNDSSSVVGSWIAFSPSNGFIMSVNLNADGTYTAVMKGPSGIVVYDDSTAYMTINFFDGSKVITFESALPYAVTLDANGNISVKFNVSGRSITINKTA